VVRESLTSSQDDTKEIEEMEAEEAKEAAAEAAEESMGEEPAKGVR
jgi:hypothetical protein